MTTEQEPVEALLDRVIDMTFSLDVIVASRSEVVRRQGAWSEELAQGRDFAVAALVVFLKRAYPDEPPERLRAAIRARLGFDDESVERGRRG